MRCSCFGERTVLAVYQIVRLEDFFEATIIDGEIILAETTEGAVRMVKEQCHTCGAIFLAELTFPL